MKELVAKLEGLLRLRSIPFGMKLFETVAPQSEAIYAQLAREIGAQRIEQIYGLLDEVIGILENSGNSHSIKELALRRAQQTPDMAQLVSNLRSVKEWILT